MRSTVATFLAWMLAATAQQTPQQAAPPAQTDQQTNQALTPKSGATFSTTTQLVVETVFVKDKSGKPIKGLTKDDFTILEDGKPQQITMFDYEELQEKATIAPNVDTAPPTLEKQAEEAKPDPAAVKPIVTNQISPEKPGDIKYKDRRLMVMFFDMTSMPIQDQFRAQTNAQKFLKTQMTPSDLVAMMTFSSDVKLNEDFTDDRDRLSKDIKGLTIGEGQGFDETTSDDSTSDTGAAFTQDDTEFNIFNTDRQLTALETACRMLGSLNEKKALIYFASGVTRNGTDNDAQLRATENSCIRANVSIYPIDARGLVASAPLGDATKTSPGGSGMYTGSSGRAATSNFQGQQETLTALAADTGGKALLDNNDLSMGIVQAQQDISSYYILAYHTGNQKLDGAYRKVDVKLKPGPLTKSASLEFRRGYIAGKEYAKFTSSDKERQLSEALVSNDPATDINIALEIDYFRLARAVYFVPVSIKIPGSELVLAKRGGAAKTSMDFIFQVNDLRGKPVQNVRDAIPIKLSDQTAAELSKRPIAYDTGFTLAPGKYVLKCLVREDETGKMGTFETKFTVPDLSAAQPSLPISSVVLSSQRTEQSAAVFNAEKDKKILAASPLIQDGKKLVPSVTRVFNKNQDMYVYLEAYEPEATATEPVIASVSFYRGKVKAFESGPLQVEQGLNEKSKALPLRFSLPLSKLQAGRYTCQVSVLNPGAQKFAFWRAPIILTQ